MARSDALRAVPGGFARPGMERIAGAVIVVAAPGPNPVVHLKLTYKRLRPGVRMLRAGRQRGVLGSFSSVFEFFHSAFELPDSVQQRLHEGPNSRGHLGFK